MEDIRFKNRILLKSVLGRELGRPRRRSMTLKLILKKSWKGLNMKTKFTRKMCEEEIT
jgi:hypothetical protein